MKDVIFQFMDNNKNALAKGMTVSNNFDVFCAVTDLLLDGFTDISMKIENEELTIDPETRLPFKEIFS